MSLIIFKVLGLMILFIFVFFVSDFRNKEGMISLVDKKWILIIKLFYTIPILLYFYIVLSLEDIQIYDYIAFILTLSGTFIVVKAKKDMGKYHTWAGHKLNTTRMITRGIYSFIRHPLYTGINIFILGALVISINHNPFNIYLSLIAFMIVVFIMAFLVMMALKESQFLLEEFGEEYIRYRSQVHAFLPTSKFYFEE